MKVLFATKNKAKLNSYRLQMEDCGIEIIGLNEIDLDIEVDETGITPTENAIMKAKIYHEQTGYTTIAIDDGLVLDNVPEEVQPYTHVRRIHGNDRATDDELIEYYTKLVSQYGEQGILHGKWLKSIALVKDNDVFHHEFELEKIFTNKVFPKRNEGYPLDSISIDPELNKYTVEMTEEESKKMKKTSQNGVQEFIKSSLKI